MAGSCRQCAHFGQAHNVMLPIFAWRPEQAKNCDAAPSEALINYIASDATESTALDHR